MKFFVRLWKHGTEIGRASCRESEGKAKIEGYMRVSDEEAHQRSEVKFFVRL